jgi:hypothetical protein
VNKVSSAIAIAAIAVAALSACKKEAAAAPVDVRATMQDQVNPAMTAIWDVGNNALDDNGGLDAALLDDAKWATVADNADKLAAAGTAIAEAGSFVAAAAANSTVAEGEITMAAVQQHIDANPDGLKQMGAAFADTATRLAAAARAKDARTAGDLISGMDQVCESCHLEFWYPEQKELVEQAEAE